MAQPETIDVTFPLNGIDTATGYGAQRPNTSADAVNVRSIDPLEERYRGGSRHGLEKYPAQQIPEGTELIQHLNQLIVLSEDYLLASFEYYSPDFFPDNSTNNGGTRNPPGRQVPPFGSGVMPSRLVPVLARRRVQGIATPQMQYNGNAATIAGTLTDLPAATGLSGLLTMNTIPRGRDGDGDTVTTNGSGSGSFSVNESTYTGPVIYILTHQYTDSITGRQKTVTGYTKVNWKARRSLQLVSDYGYIMYSGIGAGLPQTYTSENIVGTVIGGAYGGAQQLSITATVTNPSTGLPVPNVTVTFNAVVWPPDFIRNTAPGTFGPYTAVTNGSGEAVLANWTNLFFGYGYTFVVTASATVDGTTISDTITIQSLENFQAPPTFTTIQWIFRSSPPEPGS